MCLSCCPCCKRCRITLVDLVSEQSQNRYLTVFTFLLVLCGLSAYLLIPILSANLNFTYGEEQVAGITMIQYAPNFAKFNSNWNLKPVYRVFSDSGNGMSGVTCKIEVVFNNDNIYDSLEYYRSKKLLDNLLINNVNTSDSSGFCFFTNPLFKNGFPGIYRLRFVANDYIDDSTFFISVAPNVGNMKILTEFPDYPISHQTTISVDVQLLDSNNNPLNTEDISVIALSPRIISSSWPILENIVILHNNEEYTDSNSIVHFNLVVNGTTSSKFAISFFSQGVEVIWTNGECSGEIARHNTDQLDFLSNGILPFRDSSLCWIQNAFMPYYSQISSIELINYINSNSTFDEGEIIRINDQPLELHISPPLENRVCFALIDEENDFPKGSLGISIYSDIEKKRILNPIAISDSNGFAVFWNISFSFPGKCGPYEIVFVCDGIISSSYSFEITPTISYVSIVGFPNGYPLSLESDSDFLYPQPVISITLTDPAVKASGKRVTAFIEPHDPDDWDLPDMVSILRDALQGNVAITDEYGYARFDKLRFSGGISAVSYDIYFSCETISSSKRFSFIYFSWSFVYELLYPNRFTCAVLFSNTVADGEVISIPSSKPFVFYIYDKEGKRVSKDKVLAISSEWYLSINTSNPDTNLQFVETYPAGHYRLDNGDFTVGDDGSISFNTFRFDSGYSGPFYLNAEISTFSEDHFVPICNSKTFSLIANARIGSVLWNTSSTTFSISPGEPLPLNITVLDSSLNPLPNVPVSFFVESASSVLPAELVNNEPTYHILTSNDQFLQREYSSLFNIDTRFSGIQSGSVTDGDGQISISNITFSNQAIGTIFLIAVVEGISTKTALQFNIINGENLGPLHFVDESLESINGIVGSSLPTFELNVTDTEGIPLSGYKLRISVQFKDYIDSSLRIGEYNENMFQLIINGANTFISHNSSNHNGSIIINGLTITSALTGCYSIIFSPLILPDTSAALLSIARTVCVVNPIESLSLISPPKRLNLPLGVPLGSEGAFFLGITSNSSYDTIAVRAVPVRYPISNSVNLVLSGEIAMCQEGICTFDKLEVSNGEYGQYTFGFEALGFRSTHFVTLIITRQPSIVTIHQNINSELKVRESPTDYPSVRVLSSSGAPLPEVFVTASLYKCSLCIDNKLAILEPGSKIAVTNENGIASFPSLMFLSGRGGLYSLRFSVGDLLSQPTLPFKVYNTIESVVITQQWSSRTQMKFGDKFSDSLCIQITTDYFNPFNISHSPDNERLYGHTVKAKITGTDEASVIHSPLITDGNGVACFNDLRFSSGYNTGYQIVVYVDGIESKPTHTVILLNPNIPDFSKVDMWSNIAALALLSAPLLLGNVFVQERSKRLKVFWTLFGVVGTVVLISGTIGITVEYFSFYNQNFMSTFMVLIFCIFVGYITIGFWYILFARAFGYFFHTDCFRNFSFFDIYHFPQHREKIYGNYVNYLFQEPKILEKDENVDLCSSISCLSCKKIKRGEIERRKTIFYPARVLITCIGSIILSLFILFLMLQMTIWLSQILLDLKGDVEEWASTFDASRSFVEEQGKSNSVPYVEIASNYSSVNNTNWNFTNVEINVDNSSSVVQIPSSNSPPQLASDYYNDYAKDYISQLPSSARFVLDAIHSFILLPADRLEAIRNSLYASALFSLLFTFSLVILSWYMMLNHYRELQLELRKGIAPFNITKYNAISVTTYVGAQIAHSVVGSVIIWFLLTVFSFTIFEEGTRGQVWSYVFVTLLGLFGATFLLRLISRYWARFCVVSRRDRRTILQRRVFAIFDFVITYLNVASGLVIALARLFVYFFMFFFLFLRLDISLMEKSTQHLDPGYHSYVSTAIVDHDHNNPILVWFCKIVRDHIYEQRENNDKEENKEKDLRKRQIRFLWHLTLFLTNNKGLIPFRKASRNINGTVKPFKKKRRSFLGMTLGDSWFDSILDCSCCASDQPEEEEEGEERHEVYNNDNNDEVKLTIGSAPRNIEQKEGANGNGIELQLIPTNQAVKS